MIFGDLVQLSTATQIGAGVADVGDKNFGAHEDGHDKRCSHAFFARLFFSEIVDAAASALDCSLNELFDFGRIVLARLIGADDFKIFFQLPLTTF